MSGTAEHQGQGIAHSRGSQGDGPAGLSESSSIAGERLRPWQAIGLIVLTVVVLTASFCDRDLINSLETGYALTVQEMVRDGHWTVPTQNGMPRILKPPLPFWIGAVSCELAQAPTAPMPVLRGASAIMGMLTAVLVYLLARRLFGCATGLWSGLIWATCYLSVYEMRYARHDIYLTCFVVLTMLGAWSVLEGKRWGWPLTLLGLILSFQAKGPVSFGFTVLPLAIYVLVYQRRSWRVLLGLGAGMLVAALSLLPWVLTMRSALPVDLVPLYTHETIGRFRSERVSGASPFFYLQFFAYVLPWVAFLIAGLATPFGDRSSTSRSGRAFAWIWLIAGLVLLSLAREKQARYAVPLMAPAALLMGEVVGRHIREGAARAHGRNALWRAHGVLVVFTALAVPVALSVSGMLRPGVGIGCGLVLVVLALAVARPSFQGRPRRAAGWTVAYAVGLLAVLLGAQATAPSYREPLRPLAESFDELVGQEPVFTWADSKPPYALIYYSEISAPQIGHPLQAALRMPDLAYAEIVARYADAGQTEELFREILVRHLSEQEGEVVYAICRPRRLAALGEIAGPLGFVPESVLDLTTLSPRKLKPRDALELVRLTRTPGSSARPGR